MATVAQLGVHRAAPAQCATNYWLAPKKNGIKLRLMPLVYR
ncbi:hypothetical protein [Chitinibacter tainanensis]|nr:hypothetical protein [Chitinibacter tainanensis]